MDSLIFHKNETVDIGESHLISHECYVRYETGNWYFVRFGQRQSINKCDLPKWIKTYLLLLGE